MSWLSEILNSNYGDDSLAGKKSTNLKVEQEIITKLDEAIPKKRNNMHELGTFNQDELDQIEKAAIAKIFEANGFNQAIEQIREAMK